MATLAQGPKPVHRTEFRLNEVLFGRVSFEKFADSADLPTGAWNSFSLEQGTPRQDFAVSSPEKGYYAEFGILASVFFLVKARQTPLTQERSGQRSCPDCRSLLVLVVRRHWTLRTQRVLWGAIPTTRIQKRRIFLACPIVV